MAQGVKELLAEPDHLHLFPGTHTVLRRKPMNET